LAARFLPGEALEAGSFLGKIWRLVSSWGRFGGWFLPGEAQEASLTAPPHILHKEGTIWGKIRIDS
jgi:hypothetical protein